MKESEKILLSSGHYAFTVNRDWLVKFYREFEMENAADEGEELSEEELERRVHEYLTDEEGDQVWYALEAASKDPINAEFYDYSWRSSIGTEFQSLRDLIDKDWDPLDTGRKLEAMLAIHADEEDEDYVILLLDGEEFHDQFDYDSAYAYLEGLVDGYRMCLKKKGGKET